MKNLIVFTASLLILIGWGRAMAQPPHQNERIKQWKIAFFTERIPLSSEDAQVFWPVYNQYVSEMEALRKEMKKKMQSLRLEMDSKSESELYDFSDEFISHKRKELELQEKFHKKFKEILSAKKVISFYKAEADFPGWVIRQARQQFQNKRNNR